MKITQKHFSILKDFLDRKINPEDIATEDQKIILELCKARKKQIQNKIDDTEKELEELNKKLNNI